MVVAVQDLGYADQVSRHIDSPLRWNPAERRFVQAKVFEFPSDAGELESLIWRNLVPDGAALHAMGCKRQYEQRAKGKASYTYEGSVTATVGAIRSIKSRLGHGFNIDHDPEEGRDYHVAIGVRREPGQPFDRSHKSELKDELMRVFGELEAHVCEDFVGAA